jgi:hypothetical protein
MLLIEHGKWPFIELPHMLLMLGECNRNATDSVRKYKEKYPNLRIPNHHTFLSVNCWFWEMGTFHGMQSDVGCPHSVCNVWLKKPVLKIIERQPTISTRHLAACTDTSHASVHYITRSVVVSISHSVCASVSTKQGICKTWILSMDFIAVSWRPNDYSQGFIHRQIMLH